MSSAPYSFCYRFSSLRTLAHPPSLSLFGFSRGAFAARALGALIAKIGFFARGEFSRHKEYIDMWTQAAKDPCRSMDEHPFVKWYRSKFGLLKAVSLQCIGVWDTVGSIGYSTLRTIPKFLAHSCIQLIKVTCYIDPPYFSTNSASGSWEPQYLWNLKWADMSWSQICISCHG